MRLPFSRRDDVRPADTDDTGDPDEGASRGVASRRRSALIAIVAGSAVFAAGGLVGAQWVRSPQEVAALTAAPPPTVLTAPVERRVLADTVVVRGDVVVGSTIDVIPTIGGEGTPLVTGVRIRSGQNVRSGTVLLEVSGRPVIVLRGAIPAYRDLRPGADGKDIAQLQNALQGLGYPTGDPPGVFADGTKQALSAFYARIGYEPQTTGTEDAVTAAAQMVTASERSLAAARTALSRTRRTAGGTKLERRYAIADAQTAVRDAQEDLESAHAAHREAVVRSGPIVPLGEVVFVATLPSTVGAVTTQVGRPVDGPVLTLNAGAPRVVSRVDEASRALLRKGMPVSVRLGDKDAAGTIVAIGKLTRDDQSGSGHTVTIDLAKQAPRSAVGQNVRVTATAASSDGEVLVVPLSAVSSSADGSTLVVVVGAGGTQQRVPVTAGISGDGYVEVVPVTDDALDEGDQVVVGDQ